MIIPFLLGNPWENAKVRGVLGMGGWWKKNEKKLNAFKE